MFGVLVIVLGADGVTSYSLSTSEFQISFVVSSCVLDRRVRGASGNCLRPQTGWCCRLPFAPSHRLWTILHCSFLGWLRQVPLGATSVPSSGSLVLVDNVALPHGDSYSRALLIPLYR